MPVAAARLDAVTFYRFDSTGDGYCKSYCTTRRLLAEVTALMRK
jgi:hypothetical protein